MILDPHRRGEVGLKALTMRGEQGVGHTHGGEDGGGVVDAHDVRPAQDGSRHDGSVTRHEEHGIMLARAAAAFRLIALSPRDRPISSLRARRRRRIQPFPCDNRPHEGFS